MLTYHGTALYATEDHFHWSQLGWFGDQTGASVLILEVISYDPDLNNGCVLGRPFSTRKKTRNTTPSERQHLA